MTFLRLLGRDLRRALGDGTLWPPVAFFVLVAVLYPFVVGTERALLARTGGGMLWVALLLAALLPIERLLGADVRAGVIDQLRLAGVASATIVLARTLALSVTLLVPLALAVPVAGALLALDAATMGRVVAGLAIAAPGLAALAMAAAAMTLRHGGGQAIAGLIVLPLAIPILIFGAGTLDLAGPGAWQLLGAASLFTLVVGTLAAGTALSSSTD